MLHHIEEILCNREVLTWMTDMQTSALHRVTIDIVCVCDDGRELGNQLYTLAHQVVTTDIIRIWIESVHFEHTTSQDVHDIATLQLNDMGNRTVIERHIIIDEFPESLQFLLVRQLTGEQKESHLLKTESFLLEKRSYKVIQFIATIVEFTLGRFQFTLLITLITHHITDIGQTDEHTRTILIAKTTLHIEFGECLLVNLA